jgi:hypothetical protein
LRLIPEEIKNIIKSIGYKKKDLTRAETARPIYDQLIKFGLAEQEDAQIED